MGIRGFIHALSDNDTIRGVIGSVMAIVVPFIKALTPVFQFTGAVLGVILVIYSIQHKRMQIESMKNGKANDKGNNQEN